jgi:hypothetical protein
MDDFQVYLVSNSGSETHNNTLTSFTNSFYPHLKLTEEDWEVSLLSYGIHLNFAKKLNLPIESNLLSLVSLNKPEGVEYENVKTRFEFLSQCTFEVTSCGSIAQSDSKSPEKAFAKIDQYLNTIDKSIFQVNFSQKDWHMRVLSVSLLILHKDCFSLLDKGTQGKTEFQLTSREITLLEQQTRKKLDNYIVLCLEQNNLVKLNFSKICLIDDIPDLINISCDSTSSSIADDTHHNIILSSSIPHDALNTYYFHTEKNPQYFPINVYVIASIQLEFLNNHQEKLNLKRGKASFASLHFRKKMQHSIPIKISSSKENTTSNPFTASLAYPLELRRRSKIALTSIFLPNNIRTITEELSSLQIRLYCTSFPEYDFSFTLIKGCYKTEDELIEMMNSQVFKEFNNPKNIFHKTLKNQFAIHFPVPKHFKSCIFGITIPVQLKRMLGFSYLIKSNAIGKSINMHELHLADSSNSSNLENVSIIQKFNNVTDSVAIMTFKEAMNINDFHPSYTFCYCDIVEPSVIGSTHAPLLKVFSSEPHNNVNQKYLHKNFDSLEYVKINSHVVNNLNIALRSHDGRLLEFDNNEDIILHMNIVSE